MSTSFTVACVQFTAGPDPEPNLRVVTDLIRRGRCNLIVNTPDGGPEPRSDGYLIRESALAARVSCVTTIAAATAAVHAIANARAETALSLQERIDVEAGARAS